MNVLLREDKFHIRAYFAPCACNCKFCCLGNFPKNNMISFDDYEKVMNKFSQVTETHGMRLRSFIYNCPEHSYLRRQIKLYNSLPMEPSEYTQLDLNGTRIKSGQQLIDWIDELVDSGIKKVAFSWFGLEQVHDNFVNKKGYYSYLRECASLAKSKGISVTSKVFLHKGILDELDQLIETLQVFSDVIVCAFMEYSGKAKSIEEEFLTKKDYELLSDKTKAYISNSYVRKFKTEKEWIKLAINDSFPTFNIVDYILYITSDNLEWVLNTEVEEVIDYFRKMNVDFQNSFGTIRELADRYGDEDCECLYECRDVLRKWLDKYYEAEQLDVMKLFSFTNNSVEWKVYERL